MRSTPPPPPPPLPSIGGPPPPPPLPGMGPHIPSGRVPPFPDMMLSSPPSSQLPFGMAPKKKYSTITQTKRLNWNKVNPKHLETDSVWVSLQEDKFESPDIFRGLEEMFSTKPPPKKVSETAQRKPAKKGKELKVLDIKTGQNLSILLSSIKLPYEEIKNRVLAVDEKGLTASMLEQLIKSIPDAESMKKLADLKECYSDLAEPEQFVVVMSSIKRLVPRLNSILFKLRFSELVSDIKPDLVSATEALDEVKNCRKFARFLELLLLMGNYLNAGSRNAQSVGFDISFLTKLEGTKSHDGSMTLLHFVAQILESKYPDILGFLDEIIHIDKAARVSPETLQKSIASIGKQLKELELDIKNLGKSNDPNDKFASVMKNFLREGQQQYELVSAMYKKLETLYDSTAKYFAFEPKKYTMEEFFTDMKTFKDGMEKALRENIKIKETREKIRRALEAKEKSDKEKQDKKLRQAAILNMTANDNQEGVMDSLLEALKTGSAFSVCRETRGSKQRTPRAAGADRRAQLAKNQSRQNTLENSALKEINFEDHSNINRENMKNRERRKPFKEEETEAEQLLRRLKAL
uniref:FH2 domain-containing protein n=1 Tax=Arion vulgaris TaxID=1028688 RepID=A0A0B7B5Z5_9EUPU